MDKETILNIVNNILQNKHLGTIGLLDDIRLAGFSSSDMLDLVLALEKCGYQVAGLNIQDITTSEKLYNLLKNQNYNRKII